MKSPAEEAMQRVMRALQDRLANENTPEIRKEIEQMISLLGSTLTDSKETLEGMRLDMRELYVLQESLSRGSGGGDAEPPSFLQDAVTELNHQNDLLEQIARP